MKIYSSLLIIFFLVMQSGNDERFLTCKKSQRQEVIIPNDSFLIQKLKLVDKNAFVGQIVDSLILEPTLSTYKSHMFLDEPERLVLLYAKNLYLEIFVNETSYIKDIYNLDSWSFDEFRKFRVRQINLKYRGEILEKVGNAFPDAKTIYIKAENDTVYANPKKQRN